MPEVLQDLSKFATDVVNGLTAAPKTLPSKYFYDAKGDQLFRTIMALPEYYLTRAEYEIFKFQSHKIVKAAVDSQPVQLIELGAGDGLKTTILLEELLRRNASFEYFPIDISGNALNTLQKSMERNFGTKVPVRPLEGEYFQALTDPLLHTGIYKLILFLGSTIGNFQPDEASDFIGGISRMMDRGDKLLIGFDLKKDPQTILNAYNDRQGITREFNLNLLRRINRELGADFDLKQFMHYPLYDPVQGAAKSYLISLKEQEVFIAAARKRIFFKPYETIFTEISQKFDSAMIREYAGGNALRIVQTFTDSRGLFADVLFEKS